jgi:hypothetical protein
MVFARTLPRANKKRDQSKCKRRRAETITEWSVAARGPLSSSSREFGRPSSESIPSLILAPLKKGGRHVKINNRREWPAIRKRCTERGHPSLSRSFGFNRTLQWPIYSPSRICTSLKDLLALPGGESIRIAEHDCQTQLPNAAGIEAQRASILDPRNAPAFRGEREKLPLDC